MTAKRIDHQAVDQFPDKLRHSFRDASGLRRETLDGLISQTTQKVGRDTLEDLNLAIREVIPPRLDPFGVRWPANEIMLLAGVRRNPKSGTNPNDEKKMIANFSSVRNNSLLVSRLLALGIPVALMAITLVFFFRTATEVSSLPNQLFPLDCYYY